MAFVFATVAGVALVASLAAYPDLMISPGRLMHGHARFSKDCFACHRPFHGTPSDKCLSCHYIASRPSPTTKKTRIQAAKPLAPFHKNFAGKNCTACHGGHEGMKIYRPELH